MPYWILCGIDSDIVGGEYFNGFGGHNFSSVKAELNVGINEAIDDLEAGKVARPIIDMVRE